MSDIGLLLMLIVCCGALGWLFLDSFTVGAVVGAILWFFMGRK